MLSGDIRHLDRDFPLIALLPPTSSLFHLDVYPECHLLSRQKTSLDFSKNYKRVRKQPNAFECFPFTGARKHELNSNSLTF